MRRLLRVVRGAAGYSLVELVVVMLILGTILGALTTAFVSGSNAELDANHRVQAQLQAAAAFDRLRRDVHCATSAPGATSTPSSTITLSVPTGCDSTGSISWCALSSANGYALYRQSGSSCTTAGRLYADYLTYLTTPPPVFTYIASAPAPAASLAKVHVDVRVNVNPAKAMDTFELVDDIVLRNSTRT